MICLFIYKRTTQKEKRQQKNQSGHYGEVQKSHSAPCGVKNASVIKSRWNISNTGAWSSICKQESLTSTGRLFALIIPRLPLVIISTQSQSSSNQPVKINSRLQKVFFSPTATQLRSEQSKVLKMTQLIYVRNIQATVQLRGKATTTTKKKSVLEESFYTSVPPSHSFKSCSGKLEENNLGHMHSNKHPCAST